MFFSFTFPCLFFIFLFLLISSFFFCIYLFQFFFYFRLLLFNFFSCFASGPAKLGGGRLKLSTGLSWLAKRQQGLDGRGLDIGSGLTAGSSSGQGRKSRRRQGDVELGLSGSAVRWLMRSGCVDNGVGGSGGSSTGLASCCRLLSFSSPPISFSQIFLFFILFFFLFLLF